MLRMFGAKVGADVHVYPTVRITIPWNLSLGDGSAIGEFAILYALGPIALGPRATVSQYAHLCAGSHDLTRSDRPLTKPPINVGADAWIAADAFVGPGVTIDVKRAVTPAFLDRAERAAVNAMVQANRAETQAATATDRAAAAEIAASTIAGLAEAAKKPARRKTTRGKR